MVVKLQLTTNFVKYVQQNTNNTQTTKTNKILENKFRKGKKGLRDFKVTDIEKEKKEEGFVDRNRLQLISFFVTIENIENTEL